MKYFDLHCDTLYEMKKRGEDFFSGGALAVSFENAALFESYARIMAIWTKAGITDDEAYSLYRDTVSYMKNHIGDRVMQCRTHADLVAAQKAGKIPFFLAVEGATLLGGDISRLDTLYADGVRFLTLTWKDDGCIGGSWNTDGGLSDFGREVVSKCAELGIAVDLSHASHKMMADVFEMVKTLPLRVIATHSNSDVLCPHGRNLTDAEAKEIAAQGGIVGISFTPGHLNSSGTADISDIVAHAKHYLSIGLENSLCIGADFDGVVNLPRGIINEKNIVDVERAMKEAGIPAAVREKIFWQNAENFIIKYM